VQWHYYNYSRSKAPKPKAAEWQTSEIHAQAQEKQQTPVLPQTQ